LVAIQISAVMLLQFPVSEWEDEFKGVKSVPTGLF
jgi:hypothetical protein